MVKFSIYLNRLVSCACLQKIMFVIFYSKRYFVGTPWNRLFYHESLSCNFAFSHKRQRTTKPTIKTFAISEDSDQPAHPRSLIRVFADRVCLLQPPGYPMRDKRELLPYWVDVQADLSLCWLRRSYCRFCRVLAQLYRLH